MNDTISIEKVSKDTTIIEEGDSGNKAFILKKGYVEVIKKAHKDLDISVAKLGPGEIFGELALIEDGSRSASVIALTDVELLVVEKSYIDEELKTLSPIMKLIFQALVIRLRKTTQKFSIATYIVDSTNKSN